MVTLVVSIDTELIDRSGIPLRVTLTQPGVLLPQPARLRCQLLRQPPTAHSPPERQPAHTAAMYPYLPPGPRQPQPPRCTSPKLLGAPMPT